MFKSRKMCRHTYTNRLIRLVLLVNLGLPHATAAENRTSLAIFTTAVISNDTRLRDNDGVISSEADAVLTNDVSHFQHGGLTQSSQSNSTSRTAGSFYIPTDKNSIPETETVQANTATTTVSATQVPNSVVPPGIRNRQSTVFPTNVGAISTTKTHEVVTNQMREEICDGFACGEDEFCSRQWERCRACEDIKSLCQDMDDVHSNVPACEAFCIRLQKEEADRVCTAEKLVYQQEINQLHQSLTQTDSALNKTQKELIADRTRCTGEQEESRQKLADQDKLIKVLDKNLTQARKETAKCREELDVSREKYNGLEGELVALRILAPVIGLVLLGAAVAIVVLVRKCQMLQRRSTNTGDQRRLIQATTTESDQRLNINHDFGDKLLPGGARTPIFLRHERRDNIALA